MGVDENISVRYFKAVTLTAPLAVAFGILMFALPDANPFVTWVTNSTQSLVDPLRAFVSAFGGGEFFGAVHHAMFSTWFPLTGSLFVSQVLAGLALIPAGGRSFVDRVLPRAPLILDTRINDPNADPLRALSRDGKFIGRTSELKDLKAFAETGDRFGTLWFTVTGGEGVGKSRLGIEWLNHLSGVGWDAGFLDTGVTVHDLRLAYFRKKTAIVIDEANRAPELWDLIASMPKTGPAVRVLLIDQYIPPVPLSVDPGDRQALRDACVGSVHLQGLRDAHLKVINPRASKLVLERARGRPLFVKLGEDPNKELERRAERRLIAAANDSDRSLLIIAACGGPMPLSCVGVDLAALRSLVRLQKLFEGAPKDVLGEWLPAIEPGPLADAIVLRGLLDMPLVDRQHLMKLVHANNPKAIQQRLMSMREHYGIDPELGDFVRGIQDEYDAIAPNFRTSLIQSLDLIIGIDGQNLLNVSKDLSTCINDSAMAQAILALRPHDIEIVQRVMAIYANTSHEMAVAGMWKTVDSMAQQCLRYRELLEVTGNGSQFALTLGLTFGALTKAGRFEEALAYYPVVKELIFLPLLDGGFFADTGRATDATNGFVFALGAATTIFAHMLDCDELEILMAATSSYIMTVSDDEVKDAIFNLVDAISSALHSFTYLGHSDRIEPWAERLKVLFERAGMADISLAQEEQVMVALRLAISTGVRGDLQSMERQAHELIILIESLQPLDGRYWKIYPEVFRAVSDLYARLKSTKDAERWVEMAYGIPALSDTPFYYYKNSLIASAGVLISTMRDQNAGGEYRDKLAHWSGAAERLIRSKDFYYDDNIIERVFSACIEMMIVSCDLRDVSAVRFWITQGETIGRTKLFRERPAINEALSLMYCNAIVLAGGLVDSEEEKRWRAALIDIVYRFPENIDIRAASSQIPDLHGAPLPMISYT